tara:strand:+ start:28 stop:855 length:828 start_codon:yes stop_codon:yes gene_type:complete
MSEDSQNTQPPRHAPPKGTSSQRQELLYDPNVPTSSHAELARTMAQKIGTATLCTIAAEYSGHPYGSFVTYALDNGNPIFLISALAEHTKNLELDSKASLLIAEGGDGNPLALGRITLIGNCTKVPESERPRMKEIFLSKHESAKFYVDFGDFSFFRLEVDSVRYIGGFGRMSWVDQSSWSNANPDPLLEFSEDIIEHMNDDHADAMLILCQKMSKAVDSTEVVMTGIDRYGFEMSAITGEGPRPIRLGFENEAHTSDEARVEIIALVKKARSLE